MSDAIKSVELEGQTSASPPARLSVTGCVLGCLGGVLLIAMMALTVCDVIGRYLFNSPIKGASELTEILLCAVIFLGLCAVSLAEDHVVVDLLTDKMPASIHPAREALTGVLSGLILMVIAWRIWVYAAQIAGYNGATTNLSIPIAPLGYFCAICAFAGGLITAFLPLKRAFLHAKH
ncbi:TRAP transporter small permease [Aliishimia ponticola]|uniref:TRAP transporter small permease protein n=1 Tax=Aliishimia ponticola TaxID=2499833 RepID=A0A4V3XJU6_9RHOB|nr:TRAP transporter small permease [Aliishimia ponticola]THH34443.1 TRAP transporter small permease [Aliishimia ponticola]